MELNNNKKIIGIVILALLFGIIGGIFGEIMARVYIFENAFDIPFFRQINYDKNISGISSLIIRDAKNVVVEQDQKVNETAVSVGNSLVGIYEKEVSENKDAGSKAKTEKISLAFLNNAKGSGIMVTSDGWLMTYFKPAQLDNSIGNKSPNATSTFNDILKKYLVVTKDKKIFSPDKIVVDNLSQTAFWHIPAVDLPVARFSFGEDLNNGQSLLAINWQGWTWLTYILGVTTNADAHIFSSDKFLKQLVLGQSPKNEFAGSFMYNLGGEIVGIIKDANKIESIENYNSALNSILKFKTIRRPSLGINYLNLADLAYSGSGLEKGVLISKDKNGVAIIKDSPAEKAGLKEGDIILSINNIELNAVNALGEVVGRYLPGDEISLNFERDKVLKVIKVKLAEMK